MLALKDNTRDGKNDRFFLQNNHLIDNNQIFKYQGKALFRNLILKTVLQQKTMDPSSFSGNFNSGLQQFPVTKLKSI
jgi:hypothetical protein